MKQDPPQSVKFWLHITPQVVPLQVAEPFCGTGQGSHLVPQEARLVFERQLPLQLCVPSGQVPSQAVATPRQTPLHSLVPMGHSGSQARPLVQETEPPVGTEQGSQEVVPQWATSSFLTQVVPQRW